MKYRTKLTCAFITTGLLSSIVGIGVLYHQIKPVIFQDEQIKALTVSATTAALLNPELFVQIQSPKDVNGSAFQEIKKKLFEVRKANRRKDLYISFLYTIRPNPKNLNEFIAIVDPEEDPDLVSDFGVADVNSDNSTLLQHLKTHYSPSHILVDQWGKWLTGFSPILDDSGNYVATVRADISADRYLNNLHHLEGLILLSLCSSILFAFLLAIPMGKQVSHPLAILMNSVREIGKGNFKVNTELKSHDEFEELANEMNKMAQGLLERERLKQNFARYVSEYVMEKILKSDVQTKLEGERRKVTVLFSDIHEFIQLISTIPAATVVSMLNEYFEMILQIIFAHQGTLDKFMADTVMVEFGAPVDDISQEKHAVMAAIEMQKEFIKIADKWAKQGRPTFQMGIGIHTGDAVVGNIGTEERLSYTAIGDTVNVAARLEELTKKLNKSILISETTYIAVKDEFPAINLGPIELHGREKSIIIYEIDPQGAK